MGPPKQDDVCPNERASNQLLAAGRMAERGASIATRKIRPNEGLMRRLQIEKAQRTELKAAIFLMPSS